MDDEFAAMFKPKQQDIAKQERANTVNYLEKELSKNKKNIIDEPEPNEKLINLPHFTDNEIDYIKKNSDNITKQKITRFRWSTILALASAKKPLHSVGDDKEAYMLRLLNHFRQKFDIAPAPVKKETYIYRRD
jgi:hypothetical protein